MAKRYHKVILPKFFTTVTVLSKTLALLIFITLPILTFVFGVKYEQLRSSNKKFEIDSSKVSDELIIKPKMQTYTDIKYQYSFDYPGTMELIECTSGNVFPVEKMRKYDPCYSDAGGFVIHGDKSNSSIDLPEWYYEEYKITKQDIVVGGKKAIKYSGSRITNTPKPLPPSVSIIKITTDSGFITINSADLYPEIISSFKFIH